VPPDPKQEYRAGTLSTVQMKDECIAKLQGVVGEFQKVHNLHSLKETVEHDADDGRTGRR
jgi:tryptophanyl-tRNA synthetase